MDNITLDNLHEKVDELERQIKDAIQTVIKDGLQTIFEAHPNVKSIAWKQDEDEYDDSSYNFQAHIKPDEIILNYDAASETDNDDEIYGTDMDAAIAASELLQHIGQDNLERIYQYGGVFVTREGMTLGWRYWSRY